MTPILFFFLQQKCRICNSFLFLVVDFRCQITFVVKLRLIFYGILEHLQKVKLIFTLICVVEFWCPLVLISRFITSQVGNFDPITRGTSLSLAADTKFGHKSSSPSLSRHAWLGIPDGLSDFVKRETSRRICHSCVSCIINNGAEESGIYLG